MLFREMTVIIEPTTKKMFVPVHAMKTLGSGDIPPLINLDTR
jgi:hypothetical protein